MPRGQYDTGSPHHFNSSKPNFRNQTSAGDGFFDPDTNNLYSYEGMLLRQAAQAEAQWILANCRATRRLADPVTPA